MRTICLSISMMVGDIGDAQAKISQILWFFREMLRRAGFIMRWKMIIRPLKLNRQAKNQVMDSDGVGKASQHL